MPLINVIRGERIEPAPFTVATPIMRLPIGVMLLWWLGKTLCAGLALGVKFWRITLPAAVLLMLWAEYGWQGPALLLAVVSVSCLVWWQVHASSFLRWVFFPVVARFRRATYRRRWHAAMATTGLAVAFGHRTVLPVLKRVRCRAGCDMLLIQMVTGQIPDDYAQVSERLAHTFDARSVTATPGPQTGQVVLIALRGDPLTRVVTPLPIPSRPDFDALSLGRREDGTDYELRLLGTQLLVVGATGSGKGSVVWSLVRALAGGIRTGLVEVWACDPKGGMELGIGAPLFTRLECTDFSAMADMLDEAVTATRKRAEQLRGKARQHQPSLDEPLIVVLIDELAALTAYLTDKPVKERIRGALSVLLSQGRAVGVHVVAALQDPRKEVLPFRDLFPTRIGLRLTEKHQVDMVLGDGARDRGALCDRIPVSMPGVGYVILDGQPTPLRVRFSYLSDHDIRAMAEQYQAGRILTGKVIPHPREAVTA